MQYFTEFLILLLAGCVGGFISGLLGVGGGIIFVPILDYFLIKSGAIPQDLVEYTLANSFFAVLVSGMVGSFPAFKSKLLDIKQISTVGISAIVAVLTTTYLISQGHWYSPLVFKLFFSSLLVFTLIKTLIPVPLTHTERPIEAYKSVIIGLLTGAVAGLSGLGGGIILIPLFMIFARLDIKKASTLSLAIIPILALPNVLYYLAQTPVKSIGFSTGFIVWPLILPLISGVLLTVKSGVNASKMMSQKTIKVIFAVFILITILRILVSVV